MPIPTSPANGKDYTPVSAAPPITKTTTLTPVEIDALISDFESAQRLLKAAKDTHDAVKDRLINLVEERGHSYAGAEQSLRLEGRHNFATVTTGKQTTIFEPAVIELRNYLGELGGDIFEHLFAAQTRHTLVESGRDVLRRLQLPKRTDEKVMALYGKCYDVKPKSPTLKIDTIQPEKPARKPRGSKAAA